MNTLVVQIYQSANTKYHKFRGRLNKNIANGRFHRFTKRKQSQLLDKLERLRNRVFHLQTQLKLAAAGATISILLNVSPANAQTSLGPFTRNYLDNPLPPPLPYVSRPAPVYVDLDGDGDFDLVVGQNGGGLLYFENVGTKSKPRFLERESGQPKYPFAAIDNTMSPAKRSYVSAFADVDNDGDLDLLIGTDEAVKYGGGYGEMYFYRNIGNASSPNFSPETGLTNPFDGISTNRYAHPTFVDIDADGDMDLFVGGYYDNSTDYYLLQYFKNTGTASNPIYVNGSTLFPTHPLLEGGVVNNLSRNSISSPISFADLDQDGDLDFFISIYGEIIYYRNDNGSFKIQYGYNGDATQVGPWIPNPGNPGSSQGNPFDAINNDLPGGIDYLSFAFADLDNDGDMDVTVGYNEYSYYSNVEKALFYYENKGLGVLELKEGLESPVDGVDLKNHSNVSFADIDGDGDLDALTSGSEVQNKYGISSTYTYQELYKNDNGVFSLVTDPQQNPFSNLSFIGDANLKLFDLDKDGDLDLIAPYHVNDSYYSEAKVQYFQNNAGIYTELTGVNNPFDFINEGPGFEPDVDLGDLNGDGKPDLVLSRSNSRLELFENSGTLANPIFSRKMEWETGFTNNPSSENHSKFLDLDHDGDLDIIVGKYQGFWYYENIGSPETPSFLLYNALSNSNPFKGMEINSFPVNIHSPAFADLDNDGDQDLFSGDNTGQFSFFENTNPAPITGVIPNLNFTQGINPVVLDANLTISDSDNDQIVKAEVTILNFRPGDEVLSYTPDEAIDGVFNATTGILTLTGLDPSGVNSPFPLPISYFQSALRSVKYQFIGSAPTGGRLSSGRTADAVLDRSITFSVLDQDFTTPAIKTMALQITFLSSNQPPVINPITAQVAVGNSVLIDFTSLISDPNNNLDPTSFRVIQDPLSGASYTISNFVVNLDYANLDFVGQDQFTIEICDLLGACTTSLVTIDVAGDIIVYNGFSPNPDSYNPYFRIANISVFEPENKVSIFNRWGSEVFEVDNYNNDTNRFEGKNNNGNELPSGTYFYKIEFTSGRETMTGYLTLKK